MRSSTLFRPLAHRGATELFWPFEGEGLSLRRLKCLSAFLCMAKILLQGEENCMVTFPPILTVSRIKFLLSMVIYIPALLQWRQRQGLAPFMIHSWCLLVLWAGNLRRALQWWLCVLCISSTNKQLRTVSVLQCLLIYTLRASSTFATFLHPEEMVFAFYLRPLRRHRSHMPGVWALLSPWSVNGYWSQVNHIGICQWASVVSLSVLKGCTLAPGPDLGVPFNLVFYNSMIKCHRAETWSLTTSNCTELYWIFRIKFILQNRAIQVAFPHTACNQQQCSYLLDIPRCSSARLARPAFSASSRSRQHCSPGKIWPERSSLSAIVQYISMSTHKMIYDSCQCST